MAEDIETAGPACSASQRRVQLAVTAVVCAWFAVAPAPPIDDRQYFERFTPAALQMEPWETKIRDRAYLAGSSSPAFPASVEGSDGSFPAFFRADANLAATADLARVSRRFIDMQLDLHGAVVLRGLPITDARSFSALLHGMEYNLTRYVGGVTQRGETAPMIYPASNEDPQVSMDLHQDNVYWPTPPAKLFFYYERPAAAGGLNPILSMREMGRCIPGSIADEFERRGVRYENFFPDAAQDSRFVPWQSSFNTTDPAAVEANLRAGGFSFEWTDRGLRKWNVMSPFKTHPRTGERAWANMIMSNHASYFHQHPTFPELRDTPYTDTDTGTAKDSFPYPFHVRFGDGGEVPYATIQLLRAVSWQHARAYRPEVGDLLVVDNYLAQHSRLGYKGDRRFWIAISLD